jgi:hypothetical protein
LTPKWDRFRRGQDLALFEGDAQVDVDHFRRLVVQQNILDVPIA